MDIPWFWIIAVPVIGYAVVAMIYMHRNMRRDDTRNAEIDRLFAMLTEEEWEEWCVLDRNMRNSPEYKAACDKIKDTDLGNERHHYEGDLYLRDLQEFVQGVEARRVEARVDSWNEVWNSLTETQQAAVHVAADMDPALSAEGPVGYEDRIRYVEFAMNPDWVAANREPIAHMVQELRRRRQEAAVLEMKEKLR